MDNLKNCHVLNKRKPDIHQFFFFFTQKIQKLTGGWKHPKWCDKCSWLTAKQPRGPAPPACRAAPAHANASTAEKEQKWFCSRSTENTKWSKQGGIESKTFLFYSLWWRTCGTCSICCARSFCGVAGGGNKQPDMQIPVPSNSIVNQAHAGENAAERERQVNISFEESLSHSAAALNTSV